MFTPTRTPARPTAPGSPTKLATLFAPLRRAVAAGTLKRWGIRLIVAAAVLVALWYVFLAVVSIVTSHLWFESTGHGSVYTTMIEAKIGLFVVFAVIGGLVCGFTMLALRRLRTPLYLSPDDDTFRWTFRRFEPRFGRWLVAAAVIAPAIVIGLRAAGAWQTYLLWQHAVPFHVSDPLFHKDVSFYLDVYPFHVLVVSLLTQAVTYSLWIAGVGGYWYGAWRIRRGNKKITRDMTTLMSVLVAVYLVLKAAGYWLSRYALTTSPRGPVTGAGYTDINAGLPSKYVLIAFALLAAALLLANAFVLHRVRALVVSVVVMVVVAVLAGTVWPGLLYRYREAPSAASLDLGEIAHNQTATRAAFDLQSDVTTRPYTPSTTVQGNDLVQLAQNTAQISLLDPNQLSPTFNVEQQLQAYYFFKSTLDTSHYELDGRNQDVVLAVRELQTSGIPHQGWVNNHLVYTHGYGVVAAPTTEVDPTSQSPVYLDGGIPPGQQIPITRPQVYFGQAFTGSSYAIVGEPAGSRTKLEFDHPGSNSSAKSAYTTYTGDGGIPIGSTLRRFLFAVKLRDPNIFFSSELNSGSQLLMTRDPRTRVSQVAPWLTLDGNVYPAVVDGHIKWIVDGYTTASTYPNSQMVNLHSATTTTLTSNGSSISQPSTQLNYMQNSVKAVVDAYTGKVTLYSWNQQSHPDPLLKSWESVFPGLVKPQSSIPHALLSQLRYPTDLFNVQRTLLARYHVTKPSSFYNGNDFWTVPTDPTVAAAKTINSKSSKTVSSPPIASRYMSMSPTGDGNQRYLLSTPLVTLNGRQIAAFVSVDSQPGPDYGKFTVLDFAAAAASESPLQVQNDIDSDTAITEALTLQRGGTSRVVLGSLEAIPVAGRMLYVEPVYTQSSGSSSFPILRHVIALYGNGTPSFDTTVQAAVQDAVKSGTG